MTSQSDGSVTRWSRLLQVDYQGLCYRVARFNPAVSAHEFRTRMRGYRVFWTLFAYTLIACAAFFITLWFVAWQAQLNTGAPGLRQHDLGRLVLSAISHTQLTLILLILPAYSAGAVTMEREKRTLEMLRATLLSASDVITGKLIVVLALGLTLLLTSLPVAAWCLLLGGVAPFEILLVYSYLFALCLFVATLGLCFSTLLGRSIAAVVGTYGVLIGVLIAFPIILSIIEAVVMRNPVGAHFGDTGALITIGVLGALGVWLGFLAVRWLWGRLLGGRLAKVGLVLAVLVPLGLLCYAGNLSWHLLSRTSMLWLLVTEPYFALSAVMDGLAAQSIAGSIFRGRTGVSGLQGYLWMASTGGATLFAAGLWALSIRTFRLRAKG
jgi:ABC-type transport system involved in multi-copper enzyme maturation permease subunit